MKGFRRAPDWFLGGGSDLNQSALHTKVKPEKDGSSNRSQSSSSRHKNRHGSHRRSSSVGSASNSQSGSKSGSAKSERRKEERNPRRQSRSKNKGNQSLERSLSPSLRTSKGEMMKPQDKITEQHTHGSSDGIERSNESISDNTTPSTTRISSQEVLSRELEPNSHESDFPGENANPGMNEEKQESYQIKIENIPSVQLQQNDTINEQSSLVLRSQSLLNSRNSNVIWPNKAVFASYGGTILNNPIPQSLQYSFPHQQSQTKMEESDMASDDLLTYSDDEFSSLVSSATNTDNPSEKNPNSDSIGNMYHNLNSSRTPINYGSIGQHVSSSMVHTNKDLTNPVYNINKDGHNYLLPTNGRMRDEALSNDLYLSEDGSITSYQSSTTGGIQNHRSPFYTQVSNDSATTTPFFLSKEHTVKEERMEEEMREDDALLLSSSRHSTKYALDFKIAIQNDCLLPEIESRSISSDSSDDNNSLEPTLVESNKGLIVPSSVEILRTNPSTPSGSNLSNVNISPNSQLGSPPVNSLLTSSSNNVDEQNQLSQKIINRNGKKFGTDPMQGDTNLNIDYGLHQKPSKLRDLPFTVLFLLQLVMVVYIAVTYGGLSILIASSSSVSSEEIKDNSNPVYPDPFSTNPISASASHSVWQEDIHVDYRNAIYLSCIAGLYATSLSALVIGMMMILSKSLIQSALCFTVLLCFAWGTIGIALSPYNFIPVLGIIALALSGGYTVVVWDRIPFAETNLSTALCAMRCTADIILIAFGMMMVAFIWTIGWTFALLGVYDDSFVENDGHFKGVLAFFDSFLGMNCSSYYKNLLVVLPLVISYLWTLNVIMNIVHVTISGTIKTWWSNPEKVKPCCTQALRDPFIRSLTSSFGSICFGSLVVPPAQGLQWLLNICCLSCKQPMINMEESSDSSADLVRDIESDTNFDVSLIIGRDYDRESCDCIAESFNEFGFTYIGILGNENFLTASQNAIKILKARSWLVAASDRLIHHVLSLSSIIISLSTGCFGLVVEEFDGFNFTNFQKPTSTAFGIGCIIGLVLSNIFLKVVGSAVNTILLCFAISPLEFKRNHPLLNSEMSTSWAIGVRADVTAV
mmetsp:Transcript_6360/g.9241  ORF Transcript_6360/g.9241 Transcript_6360/m.9241 type:complete len:1092 (+) Transcript_6360:98-3373(+)|eukprot:CAMPEP_0184861392 /NCGR_PEP_ID=MMETSP0580-20130426/6090_1 /TAXON_ID=1118495 /ORGANISM="Dactyliosolen fragilissimus" /LENGTH=1091 /DNA_ID=CAMNT_0027358873 /DNA_START=33 /DNA_END=3308 /DNA_ORIENTATION=-